MQVLPRSHQWGLLNGEFGYYNQDFKEQKAKMKLPEGETFEPVPLVMKAGQVNFHHALTMHGSGPNITDRPRCSLTIHLQTGETKYK
jgi:ectoine hydroxylase-related dioxygenase (phytanoyl-CoA dioxygenase family)